MAKTSGKSNRKFKKLSLVMPIYNEEATLDEILEKVIAQDYGLDIELVLVDDGSKDSSREIMERWAAEHEFIKISFNPENMGKSQTVKRGIGLTTGDLVVIQDADLEYNPEDLVDFVSVFQEGGVDLIYGNRFGRSNKVIYLQNWLGNRGLSLFSALFTGPRAGMWTQDMEVCYKMGVGEMFREVGATVESTSTFGLEPELTAKFSKYRFVEGNRRVRFQQLPIDYFPRSVAEGKKMHAVSDGLKAVWEIIKFNLLK